MASPEFDRSSDDELDGADEYVPGQFGDDEPLSDQEHPDHNIMAVSAIGLFGLILAGGAVAATRHIKNQHNTKEQ